jgi:hypothetical protein
MTNDVILRLRGKLPEQTSLDARADEHYRSVGKHYVALVEYVVESQTIPDPASEAHPVGTLRLTKIELPLDAADDEAWRELMRGTFVRRTNDGTFDSVEPDGEVARDPSPLASVKPTGAGRSSTRGRGGRG